MNSGASHAFLASLAGLSPHDDPMPFLLISLVAAVTLFGVFCVFMVVRFIRQTRMQEPLVLATDGLDFRRSYLPYLSDVTCRWIAVRGLDPALVRDAFGIHHATACSWEEGLTRASEKHLFISPPVDGWVLVVGAPLPDPGDDVDACHRFLLNLSRKLGHVQFYSTHRALSHHAWVMVEDGAVLRAYAWSGSVTWNEGAPTAAERTLGLRCLQYGDQPEDCGMDEADPFAPNAERVPALAARWSIDPAAVARNAFDERRGITGDFSSRG
jgi:hypothetical protein